MSLRLTSRHILLPVLVMGLLFAAFGLSPAYADIINSSPANSSKVQTVFTVLGTNLKVNLAGREVDAKGRNTGRCPFRKGDDSKKAYAAAVNAAKQNGERDGCPIALNAKGNPIYLKSCAPFYETMSNDSGAVVNGSDDPNLKIVNCHLPPTQRGYFADGLLITSEMIKSRTIKDLVINNIPDAKKMPAVVFKNLKEEEEKRKKAEMGCYYDMNKRIDDHFAQLQSVQCFKAIKTVIKNWTKDKMFQVAIEADSEITTASTTTMTTGLLSGVVTTPAPWIAGLIGKSAVKTAVKIGKIASDADALLTALNQGCGSILPGLRDLQNFQNNLFNTFSCQAISSLIERQLTQCIRVDFAFDLRLPQFSMSLQCPINFNLSARLSPSGFNCYSSGSIGSPLQGNFGGRSLLSGNGGMANLFNGDCFKGNSSTDKSEGGFIEDETVTSGERIPGIDCGPLSSDAVRNETIQGKVYLTSGTPVTSGWVVGATETANPSTNTNSPGNGVTTITRCDYFDNKRIARTRYVYGSGSSCNPGASGFLEGGYETNSACYGNNYAPASLPNVPDACLYPVGCLDSNGKFSQDRLGNNACPAATKPAFNANNTYSVFTTGGINGGDQKSNSCSDFSNSPQDPPKCCDPQLQDCRTRDANVPLCVCDTGDATNTIIRDPATGKLDEKGSCVDGGNVTCCSPRLNGDGWCEQNMGAGSICPDEKSNMCIDAGIAGTKIGKDGSSTTLTAGQLALSKPSPYLYLFIRPDYQAGSQQCCTTEWCNICPQHYVNAYGLSLVRSTMTLPTKAIGDYKDQSFDKDNNNVLGRGWPFIATTDNNGLTSYAAGVNPLEVEVENPINKDKPFEFQIRNPGLYTSLDTPYPLSPEDINACNRISPNTQFKYGIGEEFKGGDFGFVYPVAFKKNADRRGYAQVPAMTETPLAYLNRIRSSLSSNGVALPEIPLCSTLPICTTDTLRPPRSSAPSEAPVSQPVAAPVTKVNEPVAAPVSSAESNNTGTTTTGKTITPTEVPSAGTGQANGNLY